MITQLKKICVSTITFLLMYAFYALPATVLATFSPSAEAAECTLYETIHPNFPLTGAHLSTGKCSTCASCHAGGIFLGTPKVCSTCHSGNWNGSTMGRSSAHIPIGTTNCDACHNTTSFTSSWNMNHSAVSTQRCDSCHNNSYTSYGARGKPRDHIPTTSDCGVCHKSAGRSWDTNFAAIHAGVTTGCVTCHNGTTAKGKKDAPGGHPITSDACETCHSPNNNIDFKCTQVINDPRIQKMLLGPFFASNVKMKKRMS